MGFKSIHTYIEGKNLERAKDAMRRSEGKSRSYYLTLIGKEAMTHPSGSVPGHLVLSISPRRRCRQTHGVGVMEAGRNGRPWCDSWRTVSAGDDVGRSTWVPALSAPQPR